MGKKPVLGVLLAIVTAYVASPYVTLYRLGHAIRSGDAATLQSLVNWSSVREGIKEDICDMVIDEPVEAKTGRQLPPFGAGFVRGIAANAVDARVTPEALVTATRQPPAPSVATDGSLRVAWAFFASPTQFVVDLSAPGQATPIHLQMDLREGFWHVTRVWLPSQMLTHANART